MTSTAPAPGPVEAPPGVEARGIDLIPESERHGSPRDLFGMWLGGNLNVFYVVNGAVVISMGLSFAQSLFAIAAGNLAFLAVGFASLQGPRTGTSTFAVSRASYGPNGGRFLALFNWVTCVGFEASGLSLVVLAALAVFTHAGVVVDRAQDRLDPGGVGRPGGAAAARAPRDPPRAAQAGLAVRRPVHRDGDPDRP